MKLGFVLLSPVRDPAPSTRIAVLNMFPHLVAAGFDPQVVFEPHHATLEPHVPDFADRLAAEGFRIVVFQKVQGPSVEAAARSLRERGIRTVFSVCDHVETPMALATDATMAVTRYLKNLYPADLQARVHVVHDGIERPEVVRTDMRDDRGDRRRPLDALLVTSMNLWRLPPMVDLPAWLRVTVVGQYARADASRLQQLREIKWTSARLAPAEKLQFLGFLLHPRIRRIAWTAEGVYDHLRQADIGIIPIDPGRAAGVDSPSAPWRVKSENRLTLKMAVGLPVIATPIPAYEDVIEDGVNGFLARTPQDWQRCLAALRDPALRREMGGKARASVVERYGQAEQARRLVQVLRGLLRQADASLLDAPTGKARG